MIYEDAIYGTVEIDESVLIALMSSQGMERLRGVLQHGISGLIGLTSPITRYEHSIGAMILVRRLGGSLEEQIAALLHDISHTAFSHVIDYVYNNHDHQGYHDEQKEQFLLQTDVPAVLARHGYDWRAFLHEEAFSLLEQPSPRLCADRLDYFLRDGQALRLATPAGIARVLRHLIIAEGRIVTDDLDVARWLGYTFIAADEASWANFREVGIYEVTAQAIRRGLEIGAIDEGDIWGTDEPMWQRLKASADPELQTLIRLISADTRFVWDEMAPTFWVSTKIRTLDPDVLSCSGEPQSLSSLDAGFAEFRESYVAQKEGRWPMRVVGLN